MVCMVLSVLNLKRLNFATGDLKTADCFAMRAQQVPMRGIKPLICHFREVVDYVLRLIVDVFEHETGHNFLRGNNLA